MSQHTPGPWKGCCKNCRMIWSIPADVPVAAAFSDKDETYTLGEGVCDEGQLAANVALIAAAPDLLAACRFTLNSITETDHPVCYRMLRASIDEAEVDDGKDSHMPVVSNVVRE